MARGRTTPLAGKRTRAQDEDHEEPSSTTKRRRLGASSAPPAAGDGVNEEEVPPTTANGTSRRGRRVTAAKAAEDDQISGPDDAGAKQATKPVRKAKGNTQTKTPQPTTKKSQSSNVYDVPDSGEDELGTPGVTPRTKRRQDSSIAAAGKDEVDSGKAVNGEGSLKKKRGRPGKRDREALNGVASVAEVATERGVAPPKRLPNGISKDALDDDTAVPRGILTPRKGRGVGARQPKSVAFDSPAPEEEVLEVLEAQTPSKSSRKRSRAAEILDEPVVYEEPKTKEPAAENPSGSDEEDDDEVCAICSKPDSKPPNEIVFCDNCDMPVHQKCYGLAEIPEGDWICRNCSQDDATSGATDKVKSSVVAREEEEQRPDIANFDQHLRSAQRVLLDRCAGRRRIKLRGQGEAYDKAYQLVEQTVVAGEGNSMMVIGARGCGKTTLIESIIADMSTRHQNQFHVVRLSGFLHTDDKLALREIWRQLGREMEVEDELVNKTTNHADTMASLLALLSHPSEIAETHDGVTSKSIIFVIDEFDLFATHARQTLLYNLFDIAQARKAPIAVLGLTTRIDVVESLEKRVKSRFSHRYVYLSLPRSLPAYWDVCRQGLTVDEEDMVREGTDPKTEGHRAFWDWWNGKIESLYETQGFKDHLESHFHSTKSVAAFLTTCILPIAALSPTAPSLQIPAAAATGLSISLEAPDSKLHLLASLSDLDLSLLIAAARLDIVAHTDTVNFAMAYDEYTSLMGRQRVQSASAGMLALGGGARVWGRGAAGMAWERLVALGLLVPAAAGGRGTAGLGGLDAKMWKVDVALEEVPAAVKLNAVLARWCREI